MRVDPTRLLCLFRPDPMAYILRLCFMQFIVQVLVSAQVQLEYWFQKHIILQDSRLSPAPKHRVSEEHFAKTLGGPHFHVEQGIASDP